MLKNLAPTVLGAMGVLLTFVAGWLGLFAIRGLPSVSASDELPPIAAFVVTQTKIGTLTLAACILISGAVFIVGAFIVHHLEQRRP